MVPGQPQEQWSHPPVLSDEGNMDVAGDEPQGAVPFTIDLSTEADDDEGDLYELYGAQIPPPYTQHETYGQQQPVSTPLVAINTATMGHLVVATIIIYITLVILQVLQRSMGRYLEL
jgi:hypothetical protein